MRRLATTILCLQASLAFAGEGMLGTKESAASAFQPTQASGGSFIQMIVALLIVLGIMKFALPKLLSAKVLAKFGGKLTTGLDSSIKIEESATFPGGSLHVVTVRDRVLLLGSTANTINTLADLGQVQRADPGPAFMDFLDHAATNQAETPVMAIVDTTPVQEPVVAETELQPDVQAALKRLQQLMR
jgi:flagellar biogenesis protein FliO